MYCPLIICQTITFNSCLSLSHPVCTIPFSVNVGNNRMKIYFLLHSKKRFLPNPKSFFLRKQRKILFWYRTKLDHATVKKVFIQNNSHIELFFLKTIKRLRKVFPMGIVTKYQLRNNSDFLGNCPVYTKKHSYSAKLKRGFRIC
jgi:hypothetical protein